VFCEDLEVRAYEEIDRYLGKKRVYPNRKTGSGREGLVFEESERSEGEIIRGVDWYVHVPANMRKCRGFAEEGRHVQ